MSDLVRTALAIEKDLLGKFDAWMADHGYTNRSQAVRDLIRSALVEHQWRSGGGEVAACLCIVYDHSEHELAQELTHLQHEDHETILCSQHVHLDADRCMESILMSGTPGRLRKISDSIIASRGVRLGKLTIMSGNV